MSGKKVKQLEEENRRLTKALADTVAAEEKTKLAKELAAQFEEGEKGEQGVGCGEKMEELNKELFGGFVRIFQKHKSPPADKGKDKDKETPSADKGKGKGKGKEVATGGWGYIYARDKDKKFRDFYFSSSETFEIDEKVSFVTTMGKKGELVAIRVGRAKKGQ